MDFVLVGTGLGALAMVVHAVVSWRCSTRARRGPTPLPWATFIARRHRTRTLLIVDRMLIIVGITLLSTVPLLLLVGVSDRVGLVIVATEVAGLTLGCGYWGFLVRAPGWRPHRHTPVRVRSARGGTRPDQTFGGPRPR